MVEISTEELKRYSRHIMLSEVGLQGQQKLKNASVLVIGAGGLGAPLALYLAASGIGVIGIVDYDVVEESNLQRQILHGSADIGRKKVDSAKERLLALNPHIKIEVFEEKLSAENAAEIISKFDVVADGTDNFPTRYLVNDVCIFLGKPNVYASIFGFEGQASVFWKNHGPCYRCLFPKPPTAGVVPSCNEAGVLGVLPGVLGTIQATEVVKIILEIGEPLTGQLLIYDALAMNFDKISLQRNSNCPVCGDNPTITAPIDYEDFCQVDSAINKTQQIYEVKEMLPIELKEAKDSGKNLFLLDVREKYELDICKLQDAIHIPVMEISSRLNEIPSNKQIVVYCHLGIRSLNVAEFLLSEGFTDVYNLKGGIELYSLECDLALTRY
ncbi:MAG: molybdopterin-synthase adenylyltransferase MoeB [Bacteroidetes bacterium]|nr:molybdopterin-synthase adenylyltransferase MoeB [Bacteroidota bacterium]